MKKIIAIFGLTLLASCSELDSGQPPTAEDGGKFVLTASWNSSTRISIADEYGSVVWNSGDSIALFTPSVQTPVRMETRKGGETAEFESDTVPEETPYFALYPYNKEASFCQGSIVTSIPSVQKAVANNVDPLSFIAAGKSDSTKIAFINVCGGIRFTVSRTDITRVVFYGNDDEPLDAAVSIGFSEDTPFACETDLSQKSVELCSEEPLQNETLYYITFLPQVFERGFTMKFYNGESQVGTSVCHRPVTIRRSVYSTIRNADDPEALSGILTGEDLSVDGIKTANCYVVSSPGYYKFPARKGLSMEYIQDIASVNVVWETYNSSQKPAIGSLVSDLAYKGGYIYFRTGDSSGNALITVRNTLGAIVWSWHIWMCTGFDADVSARVISPSGKQFMDRNIGALDSAGPGSYGLLYQWGRKDPFMGISTNDSTQSMAYTSYMEQKASNSVYGLVGTAVKNPTLFLTSASDWMYTADNSLWGSPKTDYDPCPYGWKVPSSDDFNGSTGAVQTSPGLRFPACGYRNGNNSELVTSPAEVWCWTSSTNGTLSVALYADCSGQSVKDAGRAQACAIRCVKEEKE